MEENKKTPRVIDLNIIFKKVSQNKKLYFKALPITFIVSYIFILGFPRYYNTDVKLAPEMGGPTVSGTLGSIASSFGIDLDNMQSSDAITPLLYPDLMEDNGFIAELAQVQIVADNGNIKTTYHDYLQKHQKNTWWFVPFYKLKDLLSSKDESRTSKGTYDPYCLSKQENDVINAIRDNIKITFDKKTAMITISVNAQDPQVCRTMGDSTRAHLQQFITEYRTSKARNDYEYYKGLVDNAKREYAKERSIYANFSDATTKVTLKSIEMKMEDMENELQMKFNTYTIVNTQMQAAKAKIQERTPAFSVIKGAAVPVKPAGPKRMFFVLGMLILASICITLYSLKDILLKD